MPDQWRHPVALLAIVGFQIAEHPRNKRYPDPVRPGQRALRVVGTQTHGGIDIRRRANARHGAIGRLVGKHGHRAQGNQPRNIVQPAHHQPPCLQAAHHPIVGCGAALVGPRQRDPRRLSVVPRQIDQHRIGHALLGGTPGCRAPVGQQQPRTVHAQLARSFPALNRHAGRGQAGHQGLQQPR